MTFATAQGSWPTGSRVPGIRFRSLRRLPPLSRIAVGVVALVVLVALFAPLLAPHDPLDQQPQTGGTGHPSAGHWMGQDSLGPRHPHPADVRGALVAGDRARRHRCSPSSSAP